MKRCYTLSKSGNRININTYKRTLYPRTYPSYTCPQFNLKPDDSSLNVSKVSRLPWYVRFINWIKRVIFHFDC